MGGQNCRIWAQLYKLITRGFTLQPEAQLLVPRLKDVSTHPGAYLSASAGFYGLVLRVSHLDPRC